MKTAAQAEAKAIYEKMRAEWNEDDINIDWSIDDKNAD